MIYMVFLQVLEPFCPLSEQENLDSEEPEPAYSTAVLVLSQTEINSSSPSSEAPSPTHRKESCNASLNETVPNSVPMTAVTASVSDADCVPDIDQCMISLPQPSNCSSNSSSTEVLLVEKNDTCCPPQT